MLARITRRLRPFNHVSLDWYHHVRPDTFLPQHHGKNRDGVSFVCRGICSLFYLAHLRGYDILPETGPSIHKPSSLWPPSPAEMTADVHARLCMFGKDAMDDGFETTAASSGTSRMRAPTSDGGDRTPAPHFQFYAENKLL